MSTVLADAVEQEGELPFEPAPPPAALKAPRRFYRPELDMLRFFAFLLVFLHHGIFAFSPTFSRLGSFGLSLFFLLSAFLITELLQREKLATGSVSMRSFYLRRSLRIWPLYFGFLLFTVILGFVLPMYRASLGFVLSSIFMVANVYVGRYGFPTSPAGFLWSISVEEQFYLFWPLLNRYCSRRTLGVIALSAFPVGSATVLIVGLHAPNNLSIWTNALVEFQIFACGVLLSLVLSKKLPEFSALSRVGLLAAGAGLWLAAARWTGVDDPILRSLVGPLIGYYLVGLGCVGIFLSVYGMNVSRVPAPLVYLGKISYGLYVFHQLSLDISSRIMNRYPATSTVSHHAIYGMGHILVGLLLTVGIAALSYRYFERPFLKLKDSLAVIHSRAA